MGGASSTVVIPRFTKKLGDTTTQLQHLPPVISPEAIEGVLVAAVTRNQFLAGEVSGNPPRAVANTHGTLLSLVKESQKSGSFRDYLVLLLEYSKLSVLTNSHNIPAPLIELARLVNPFLHRVELTEEEQAAWEDVQFAPAFRTSDLGLVTESEKDFLVLLYYWAKLNENADEAIKFITKYAEKHATDDILVHRKEPFAETEISIHWLSFLLTWQIRKKEAQLHLSEDGMSHLRTEEKSQVRRLITICNMLLGEHRLDQICLLLSTLDTYASREAQEYVPPLLRGLARGMKKKRADRPSKEWHKTVADKLLDDLKARKREARDEWGRKAGVRVDIGEGFTELERAKFKKD